MRCRIRGETHHRAYGGVETDEQENEEDSGAGHVGKRHLTSTSSGRQGGPERDRNAVLRPKTSSIEGIVSSMS